MYKWLCIVSCQPSERKAEVQLLDAPMSFNAGSTRGSEWACRRRCARYARRPSASPMRPWSRTCPTVGSSSKGPNNSGQGDVIEVTTDLSATLVPSGTVSLMCRVVMAYPSARHIGPGRTDAHTSFLDGQQETIDAVDRFVAQQLKCRAVAF